MTENISREEPRVVVNDKRRIDPTTGEVRAGGFSNPFARSKDPADPAEAAQPITSTLAPPAELESARQEAAERLADLQRVTAEYANYRKRVDRDRVQVVANAKAQLLTDMLLVLDDIDRADRHGDLSGAFKSVADRLTSTLQRLGLAQFGTVGDPFDPAQHEAVQFATSPEVSEQTVTTVMRHGYNLGDRLLRAAVVGVTGPEIDDSARETEASPEVESQEDDVTGTAPGSSGGPGGTAPDGGTGQVGEVNESARPDEGEPKGNSAPGTTTGSSGGPGGVAPDGGQVPDQSPGQDVGAT